MTQRSMKLVHLLEPSKVFPEMKAKNLEEAIRILVPQVQKDCSTEGRRCLIEEVLARERLVSTIVGHGFALPHARSDEVSELTIGLGVFPDGLDDPTPDNRPLKIVFLLLEPKRVSKLYLKTLGVLARLAHTEGVVEKMADAKSSEELITIIAETKLTVTERLTAGDIARRVDPVRLGMTLKQVADLFFRNDILTLPVVDEDEKAVGVVRCSDLLGAAMPEYTRMIGGLSFLSEFEPFDRFLHEEDKMLVDKIYCDDFIQVDDNASIVEITSLLLHQQENALVVNKEGNYLGMVSIRYIITKVMRT
ncbi:PTS sugar transporter subunit IIA [candidate division WOR-3 bacterium]|nr:PTS sugar transporter subunit IIA [candidate division WOR-3 bacterium]